MNREPALAENFDKNQPGWELVEPTPALFFISDHTPRSTENTVNGVECLHSCTDRRGRAGATGFRLQWLLTYFLTNS